MVEGHGVHRTAAAHRRVLVGRRFKATSPNGRFAEGARVIDGATLMRVEAHGKNLFYFFDPLGSTQGAPRPAVMHVHFGMSGRFSTHAADNAPEARDTTRLRLECEEDATVALLSAMTVDLGDEAFYHEKRAKLGEDPLREDADAEALWARVRASRKSIGALLMDQSFFCGVGNIYRAEICFKASVHPEQPAASLTREQFDEVWRHTVLLLQRGFQTGSILTVDPEEAKVLGAPWTRRYIYNQSKCGRCKGPVRTWDMANRTVYACETCQPLARGTELSDARALAVQAAKQHVEFVSHCAPDAPSATEPSKLTVASLKVELEKRGLPATGKKAALVAALADAVKREGEGEAKPAADVVVAPGVANIEGTEATAEEAAKEKLAAGEAGNVEHVALADDTSDAVKGKKVAKRGSAQLGALRQRKARRTSE